MYIDKDVLGWKPIADAWLESRSPQEIHVSFILQMFPKVLHFIIFSSVSIYQTLCIRLQLSKTYYCKCYIFSRVLLEYYITPPRILLINLAVLYRVSLI